jgi:hypothetical protein
MLVNRPVIDHDYAGASWQVFHRTDRPQRIGRIGSNPVQHDNGESTETQLANSPMFWAAAICWQTAR